MTAAERHQRYRQRLRQRHLAPASASQLHRQLGRRVSRHQSPLLLGEVFEGDDGAML